MTSFTLPNLTILTLNEPKIQDFAQSRNDLLKTVTTPWVLFLDSDETLSDELKAELKILLSSSPKYRAYKIPRQDHFLGKKLNYGETGHAMFVRLAQKDWGYWEGRVHERWLGPGSIGKLHGSILHHPHPTLSGFVTKLDSYSSLAAAERYAKKIPASLWQILIFPIAKFIANYFFKLGLLDGVPGIIHAFMMSWHSYLTHAKLYLLWQKK